MLAAICTGVLSGLGYALIFMRGSSTGGSDFIMLSIKELHPHLSLGNISFAMEAVVILAGTILVSKNIDGLIYGMLISFILSVMVDKVMYGISAGKMALIVTDHAREVAERIDQTVGRGSTFLKARGSFSEADKDVVMCACSTKQMYGIRTLVKEIDPNAFLIIMESNEIDIRIRLQGEIKSVFCRQRKRAAYPGQAALFRFCAADSVSAVSYQRDVLSAFGRQFALRFADHFYFFRRKST